MMTRKEIEDRLLESFDYDSIPHDEEARDCFFRDLNPVNAIREEEWPIILGGSSVITVLEEGRRWEDFVTTLAGRIYARWKEVYGEPEKELKLTEVERATLDHILAEADLTTILGPEGYKHFVSIREKLTR
jgi:hypothetical protein